MGYCFMTMNKITTLAGLQRRAEHNLREAAVPNADPDKAHLNEELVKVPDGNILKAWENRKNDLPAYAEHQCTLRKDAVKAIEIVMTVPKEDAAKIDLEKWKQENIAWLKRNFDISPSGTGSNILSVVYHGDESNAHIHAIVTPVDERGRFTAEPWFKNRKTLTDLQTNYGRAMQQFGLKRGMQNTRATHKDIKRFYSELDQRIDVEKDLEIKPKETLEEYKNRMTNYVKDLCASQMKTLSEKDRNITELKTQLHQKVKEETLDEVIALRKEQRELSDTKKQLESEIEKWQGIERVYGDADKVFKKIETADALDKALKEYPDRTMADATLENIREMLHWQNEIRKEQEKEQEEEKKRKAKEQKAIAKVFGD